MSKNKIEIMSPAGSFESLHSAINAGADSVYFGIEQLNMRARSANNFKVSDLPKIIEICKGANVKTYLTVNTILYDHDLEKMREIVSNAKKVGVTAIIATDLATILCCKELSMECHISTMQNISNFESVKFFSQYADTVVLARELTLSQIKDIHNKIIEQNIRGPKGELLNIEIFAHGAMCVALSGKCYMSLMTQNASANRGACLQNCRRAYRVTDDETGAEFVVDNKYIMSPKDLCTIGFLDKLIDAGITVLKLEGRGRSADYVSVITKTYRSAVDSISDGTYSKAKIDKWIADLETVYNRGFWHGGYYLGKKLGEWSGTYGSVATKEKVFIGKVTKYYVKSKIAEILMETETIALQDEFIVMGETTGVLNGNVASLYVDGKESPSAKKGDLITVPVTNRVRKNDKVFKIVNRKNYQ